ncbi:hypothetical protein EJB05_29475, partial [Eragrostis curvula]
MLTATQEHSNVAQTLDDDAESGVRSFDHVGPPTAERCGALHVILLGSYTCFARESAQSKWLHCVLAETDRGRTAFVVSLVHAPWYNSN